MCSSYVIAPRLSSYLLLTLWYLLHNYALKTEMAEICGISVTAEFRKIDRCGHFRPYKVFRQVNRPHVNCDYNACPFVSQAGSGNISKVILASS